MTNRLLLDTNIVLACVSTPERLTQKTRNFLDNAEKYISVMTYWEVLVKSSTGKLSVGGVREWWLDALLQLQAAAVPFFPDHVNSISHLPMLHKDPFDRAILAQARIEELTVVTSDSLMLRYANPRLSVVHFPLIGPN